MPLTSIEKMPDLSGRIVIVRCDFNVSMKNGEPLDTTKIKHAYPTIKYLTKHGAAVIIVSHLGRPVKTDKKLSLRPIYNFIKKDFPSLRFVEKPIAKLAKHDFAAGSLFLLENIRFNIGEWKNDVKFAKQLARLGDFYVNEAFANIHRKHASMVALAKLLPSYAGLDFLHELSILNRVKFKKPTLVIIGGLKVDNKLELTEKFLKKGANILLAGGASFLLLKKQGYSLGSIKTDATALRRPILKRLLTNKKIFLPRDLIVADAKTLKRPRHIIINPRDKKLCTAKEAIFDIGPRTVLQWSIMIKKAQTIIWTGPVGYVDFKQFSHASVMLAKTAASRASGRAFGVVGGGETLYAITLSKMGKYFDHVSTGGGALLNFLAGEHPLKSQY